MTLHPSTPKHTNTHTHTRTHKHTQTHAHSPRLIDSSVLDVKRDLLHCQKRPITVSKDTHTHTLTAADRFSVLEREFRKHEPIEDFA